MTEKKPIDIWHDNKEVNTLLRQPTREDCLAWVNKKADSECFVNRNLTSLKTEEDTQYMRLIQKYIMENLK